MFEEQRGEDTREKNAEDNSVVSLWSSIYQDCLSTLRHQQ